MSEQDSKMVMLQTLAPNAVKAYKRKKLLMFPSSNNNSLQGQGEMELDSGDGLFIFNRKKNVGEICTPNFCFY